MLTKKESHTHDFTKLGILREVGTTKTRTINRVILIRSCECKASQAFECGNKDTMIELYKRLAPQKRVDVF